MTTNVNTTDGFSKLSRKDRLKRLIAMGILTTEDSNFLCSKTHLPFPLAEKLIENLIGYYQLPLGVAVNFNIDDKDYVIPMAVEETSIIAAASKTAKWIKTNGRIITSTLGYLSIGQIQLAKVINFEHFKKVIELNKSVLIASTNANVAASMVKRGGGLKDIIIRQIKRQDGHDMAVIHLLIETCNAMGANIINQMCEYLKTPIEKLTGETVNLCIMSNLTDTKLSQATIILDRIDPEIAEKIEEASLFAQLDPYRAATSNKGVLNGMDPVVIATGNDWRALEAGVHAYAAHTGNYCSITTWKRSNNQLIGTLKAPINVGTVGGVTRLHPTANLCLRILGINSACKLARIIAAVGLVQNLGALRALTSEGIVRGHMKLHITNLCLAAGANKSEIKSLQKLLKEKLDHSKYVTMADAVNILENLRK